MISPNNYNKHSLKKETGAEILTDRRKYNDKNLSSLRFYHLYINELQIVQEHSLNSKLKAIYFLSVGSDLIVATCTSVNQ